MWGGAKQLAASVAVPAERAATAIGGKGFGQAVGKAVDYAPHMALGYGAYRAKKRLVDEGPLAQPYEALKWRAMMGAGNYASGGYY